MGFKKISNKFFNVLATCVMSIALLATFDFQCSFLIGQPKMPDKLKKLKDDVYGVD